MKLYRKLKYFAIPVFAAFMSFVLIVSPVSASSSSLSFYDDLLEIYASASGNASVFSLEDSVYEDVGTHSLITFKIPIETYFTSNYATQLYLNGYSAFYINLPISPGSGLVLQGVSYDYEYNDVLGSYVMPSLTTTTSRTNIRVLLSVFFDNFYIKAGRNRFLPASMNIYVTFRLPVDYIDSALQLPVGTPVVTSAGISMGSNVTPSVTAGLAGLISQSVLFGLQQYNSNDYLVSMRDLLSSIYSNDVSLYQQILSQLIADTQNDNRLYGLFELLMRDLFTYTYSNRLYDMAELTYFIMSSNNGIQSDLSRWVNELWPNYINQGEATAAAAQSSADAANNAMESAGIALEVPTRDISSDLAGASNYLTPEVASSQGDLFFWLRGNHILVVVLTLSVTFGLMGFILYGKA